MVDVDLREVAALCNAGDDEMLEGDEEEDEEAHDGDVAVADANAADIDRIAAADEDRWLLLLVGVLCFEDEEAMFDGAEEDDNEDNEDDEGEGIVWCWFVEEVGDADRVDVSTIGGLRLDALETSFLEPFVPPFVLHLSPLVDRDRLTGMPCVLLAR